MPTFWFHIDVESAEGLTSLSKFQRNKMYGILANYYRFEVFEDNFEMKCHAEIKMRTKGQLFFYCFEGLAQM